RARVAAAAPADHAPGDVAGHQHHQGAEHVERVPVDVGVDRVDVVTGHIPDGHPGGDPDGRPDHVVDGEGEPAHLGDARDNAVGLAQPHDEAGDDHHDAAVAVHDRLGPVQMVGL